VKKKLINEEYIEKTQAKIDEVKEEYRIARLNNTSSVDKKKLRNKKTAMETRVKEKKKMNEMVELVDEQNQKLEYIYSVIAREIKAAPGLVNKINAKMSTLEGI